MGINRKSIYKFFIYSGIFLFIISFFSFIWIGIDQKLSINLSYQATKDFFSFFEFPIKFLVASVACFTLGITFLRAYQFDENLRISTSHNLFNNYFKFREEFEKHFSKSRLVSLVCPNYIKEPRQVINYLFVTLYGTDIQNFSFKVSDKLYSELLVASKKAITLFKNDNLPVVIVKAINGRVPTELRGIDFIQREIRMRVAEKQRKEIEQKFNKGLIGVKYESSIHLNCLNSFLQFLLLEELSYFDNQILDLNSNWLISAIDSFEPYFRNVGLIEFKR